MQININSFGFDILMSNEYLSLQGSGHTVPEYKPQESLYFYKQFLNGLPV